MSLRAWWSQLSQGARVGSLVALALVLLGGPFLIYAGLALQNAAMAWGRSAGGEILGVSVGLVSLTAYLIVVFGVPLVVGGCVGSIVQRSLGRTPGSGA